MHPLIERPTAHDRPAQPEDALAFRLHLRELILRSLRAGSLLVTVSTLLWWPLDLLYRDRLPDVVRTLAWVRPCGVAIMLAGIGSTYTAWGRRHTVACALVVLGACHGILGAGFGSVGGLDRPFFHFAMLGLVIPLVAPMPLGLRLAGVLSVALSLAGGFFLPYPAHLRDPHFGVTVSFLGFATIAALVLGHIVYALTRRSFFQERSLARLSGELGELNGSLERRVAEQTDELRRLAAHIEDTREEERTRIARELHDELGQELTALHYALTLAQRRYEKEPVAIGANLRELKSLLERTTTHARQIVTDLRPRVLDEFGLSAAIEWLVTTIEGRTGIRCQLNMRGLDRDLDEATSTAAFRILQEALTNVTRHARARQVDVTLDTTGGALSLSVRDDGAGFTEVSPGRWGLIGMRERARVLGGEIAIDSAPGRGTTVGVRLPLRPAPPAQEVSA